MNGLPTVASDRPAPTSVTTHATGSFPRWPKAPLSLSIRKLKANETICSSDLALRSISKPGQQLSLPSWKLSPPHAQTRKLVPCCVLYALFGASYLFPADYCSTTPPVNKQQPTLPPLCKLNAIKARRQSKPNWVWAPDSYNIPSCLHSPGKYIYDPLHTCRQPSMLQSSRPA